jgi:hypothetical protein
VNSIRQPKDSPGETLDTFFGKFDKPFPERVATDELGYSPAKSLRIEGWTWSGKPPAAGTP